MPVEYDTSGNKWTYVAVPHFAPEGTYTITIKKWRFGDSGPLIIVKPQ